tara:strand:+ start:198 stop:818 length:621 start_codon:yes stop_codon:yes gene_type:complete
MKRAISVDQLYRMKFRTMPFEGKWAASFGEEPEMNGVWLIWGNSGNGKTRFTLQLIKYLCSFGRCAYNTLEEGARKSFQKAAIETNLQAVKKKLIVLDREPIDELHERLRKRKSPDICVIDSLQYAALKKHEYIALKENHPKKLFIFISHAEGTQPQGTLARFVRYDADVKIHVEGFRAFITSRYGGNEYFDIWPEQSAVYWQEVD